MNVFFIEVYVVRWNNETCAANLDGGEFPSTTIFDINAETNKPAFSFYSRHHIATTKIPEILNAIDGQLDKVITVRSSVENGETKVCCDKGDLKGFCLPTEGTLRVCKEDDLDQVEFDLGELEDAVEHWLEILQSADTTKALAINDSSYGNILNWFEQQELYQYVETTDFTEDEKTHIRMEKAITDYSQLAPESLTDMMNPLTDASNPFIDPLKSNAESKRANRIQFSGSSGSYTLKLDRSSSSEITTMSCSGSDWMKAIAIWQKLVNFDETAKEKLLEKVPELSYATNILEIVTDGLVERLVEKYETKNKAVKNKEFQEELNEEVKKQNKKRADRMEAIKKLEDEKKQKVEDARKAKEANQKLIDEETDLAKKKELIKQKFELIAAQQKAENDLEEERAKKKKENLAKQMLEEKKKEKEKKKLSPTEKAELQDQIDNETDPEKKKALVKKQLEDSFNTPRNEAEAKAQKEAMKKKRNEERSNKELKDRTQTETAEDTGKKSKWSDSSFLKNALKNLKFATSAGPMVIASMQAGCNSETKSEAAPADLDLSFSVWQIGVDASWKGGKQMIHWFYTHFPNFV